MATARLMAMLGLDGTKFKKGMSSADKQTKKFDSRFKALGKTMAGVFGAAALAGAFNKVSEFASEIRHTADNIGITTDALQALTARGQDFGLESSKIIQSLGKIKDAQAEALKPTTEYATALKAAGINLTAFAQASPEQALGLIADALANGNKEFEVMNVLTTVFGTRIGPKMRTLVKDLGEQGWPAFTQAMANAGRVMDESLITSLEDANTKLGALQNRLTVGGGKIAGAAIGWIDKLGAALGGVAGKIDDVVGSGGKVGLSHILGGGLEGVSSQDLAAGLANVKKIADEKARRAAEVAGAQATALGTEKDITKEKEKQLDLEEKVAKQNAKIAEKNRKEAQEIESIRQKLSEISKGFGVTGRIAAPSGFEAMGAQIGSVSITSQLNVLDRQLQVQENIYNFIRSKEGQRLAGFSGGLAPMNETPT